MDVFGRHITTNDDRLTPPLCSVLSAGSLSLSASDATRPARWLGHRLWTRRLWLRPYHRWARTRRLNLDRWTRRLRTNNRRTRWLWRRTKARWTIAGAEVVPLILVAIPRAIPVVIVPVAAYDEANDRQSERRSVAINGHRSTLIDVLQVLRVHPAAITARRDVTPAVIALATIDINGRTARHPDNQRVAAIRTGAHVDIFDGNGFLSDRDRCQHQRRQGDNRNCIKA